MNDAPVHATTIAIDGCGVMLMGASGTGKSDLALRLIDRGAELVSDDYTVLTRTGDAVIASPPAAIAGQIEVRGIGIVALPYRASAPVVLLVRLDIAPQRMPVMQVETIAGVPLPLLPLDPRELSAPIKLEIALRRSKEAG